jgi:hypothetical protein
VLRRFGRSRSLAQPPPSPELIPALYARAAEHLPFRAADKLFGPLLERAPA